MNCVIVIPLTCGSARRMCARNQEASS
jgi:hypothetical protein